VAARLATLAAVGHAEELPRELCTRVRHILELLRHAILIRQTQTSLSEALGRIEEALAALVSPYLVPLDL
jgi:hypothetical protein